MEIKQSTNYHHFTTITGNRHLSEKKIKNIIADIENDLNLLPYCPILVYKNGDNDFKIADGQHRHEISKRTKNPVYYIECDKLNLKQIARMNSRSDKWTNKNFLDCYVNLGINDYVQLRDFIKKHHVVYSAAITILMTGKVGAGGSNLMEAFRNGEFKCNHFKMADEVTELTTSIFELYMFNTDRYLIAAMQELKEKGKCDFSVLRRKLKEAPNEMCQQSSKKDYIYNIERVYNHNNKIRVAIF